MGAGHVRHNPKCSACGKYMRRRKGGRVGWTCCGITVLDSKPHNGPRIVAWLRDNGPAYAVEVGKAVGIRQARAGNRMRVLEERHELISEYRPSPLSGLGRRYYRVR